MNVVHVYHDLIKKRKSDTSGVKMTQNVFTNKELKKRTNQQKSVHVFQLTHYK